MKIYWRGKLWLNFNCAKKWCEELSQVKIYVKTYVLISFKLPFCFKDSIHYEKFRKTRKIFLLNFNFYNAKMRKLERELICFCYEKLLNHKLSWIMWCETCKENEKNNKKTNFLSNITFMWIGASKGRMENHGKLTQKSHVDND